MSFQNPLPQKTKGRSLVALATCLVAGMPAALVGLAAGCTLSDPGGVMYATNGAAQTSVGSGKTSATAAGATAATGTGAGSGGGAQSAPFTISLNNSSPQIDLDDQAELILSIDPKGFVGPVTFTVDNLDAATGITAAFTADVVTLDGSTMATTSLTLTTMSSSPPADVQVTITGTGSSGVRSTNAMVTVLPAITINIPVNVDASAGTTTNPNTAAFGDYPTMITAPGGISATKPVTVRFYNADDVAHEIHASQGGQGFLHDQSSIPPHTMDPTVRKVTAVGTYNYYLHDEQNPITVGQIVIQ